MHKFLRRNSVSIVIVMILAVLPQNASAQSEYLSRNQSGLSVTLGYESELNSDPRVRPSEEKSLSVAASLFGRVDIGMSFTEIYDGKDPNVGLSLAIHSAGRYGQDKGGAALVLAVLSKPRVYGAGGFMYRKIRQPNGAVVLPYGGVMVSAQPSRANGSDMKVSFVPTIGTGLGVLPGKGLYLILTPSLSLVNNERLFFGISLSVLGFGGGNATDLELSSIDEFY